MTKFKGGGGSFLVVLLFLCVLLYSFGDFSVLPLNVSHILALIILYVGGMKLFVQRRIVCTNVEVLVFVFLMTYCLYGFLRWFDKEILKNVVNLFVFLVGTFLVVRSSKKHFLLKVYILSSKALLFFSFIQLGLYVLNVDEKIYSFRVLGIDANVTFSGPFLRLYSIATEPANLAALLLPALILSIEKLFFGCQDKNPVSKKYAICTVFVYLLTFSLVAYVYMVLALIANIIYNRISLSKAVIGFFLVVILMVSAAMSPSITSRVNSFVDGSGANNLSVYAVMTNVDVVRSSLSDNFLFGGGLFSHSHRYDTVSNEFESKYGYFRELNRKDASSLYLRLASETGVIGVLLFICFFVYMFLQSFKRASFFSFVFLCSFCFLGLRSGVLNYSLIWVYFFCIFQFLELKKHEVA